MAEQLVDLNALTAFLAKQTFPTTAGELAKRAVAEKVETSVCKFLQALDHDIQLSNAEELVAQASVYDILVDQEKDAPPETLRSPQD